MDRILTLKQYVEHHQRAKVEEYDIPLSEAAELWPEHALRSDWWKYVEKSFNDGADFSHRAAHMLTAAQLRDLSRTARGLETGLPDRYLHPGVPSAA
jgi:hypothetical protein